MPPHYPVHVIEIRPGFAEDAPAIALVRRESWHAADEGIEGLDWAAIAEISRRRAER